MHESCCLLPPCNMINSTQTIPAAFHSDLPRRHPAQSSCPSCERIVRFRCHYRCSRWHRSTARYHPAAVFYRPSFSSSTVPPPHLMYPGPFCVSAGGWLGILRPRSHRPSRSSLVPFSNFPILSSSCRLAKSTQKTHRKISHSSELAPRLAAAAISHHCA